MVNSALSIMNSYYLVFLFVYTLSLGMVGDLINKNVDQPYMDEIFHVPQAQHYCAGNFSHWDEKITTLPGLYLFSVGMLNPVYSMTKTIWSFTSLEEYCSLGVLRSVNMLMSVINLVLIYTITSHLHGLKEAYSDILGLWSSVNIALLPVLYFYSYLYYTDQVSTCMVLLTLCLHLGDQDWLAGFTGALSILCRQTNIIWVFFCAAMTAGNIAISEVRHHQMTSKQPPTFSLNTSGQLWELYVGLSQILQSWKMFRLLRLILVKCGGYIIVGIMFLAFVHINNGVVVGDRSAHMVTIHLPQICYFAAFFTVLTLPLALKHVIDFFTLLRQHLVKVTVLSVVMVIVIHFNTLAHPYLLADNRHYTFYIWRKIFMRHWSVKFLLVPVYIFGLHHIAQTIAKSDLPFKIFLPLCAMLNIVPQLLLEFRYFIIPFILIRIQWKPVCWKSLAVESCLLIVINFATIYTFLFRTFAWESEPGQLQRFMW